MVFTSVTQLLQDARHKPTLDGLIDTTHAFLIDPEKEIYYMNMGKTPDKEVLGQFSFFDWAAPMRVSDDFRLLEYQIRRNMSIASVTPTGGEVPATLIGQLIKIEGGMIKLTLSHVYDEQTQIRMIELGQSNNIPREFIKLLFGSVNDLQFKIVKLLNVLTAQMLYQGKIQFVDPRTNAAVEVEQPDIYPELYPAPVSVSWDNYPLANGIQDLIDHCYAYYQINGFYPECIGMAKEAVNHLLRQESTARYAVGAGLISDNPTSNLPTRVTRKILNQLAEETMEFPMIKEFDAQYELEVAPGRTTRARYIPSTHYVLCSKDMGNRILGPTIESAKTSSGSPVGGIYLKSEETVKTSPPIERSYAVARAIPFFSDSRRMGARQIITT